MELALYQPDIPQNAGNMMRTAACLDVPVHIIEPAGFDAGNSALRRAGLDYLDQLELTRHESFEAFEQWRKSVDANLVLLTSRAKRLYFEHRFLASDVLLLGRETAGVPDNVRERADRALKIPMAQGTRSLNVAAAAAMVLGEALRQTKQFPG